MASYDPAMQVWNGQSPVGSGAGNHPRRWLLSFLGCLLFSVTSLVADPLVTIHNLTVGTNKTLQSISRIGRCEVTGVENCRVVCKQGGRTIQLFPFVNGKVKIWVYGATGDTVEEELRVNISDRKTIARYDALASRFRGIEGLIIDIDGDRLVMQGSLFSTKDYQRVLDGALDGGYDAGGVRLHPYVNAVLAADPSDMGDPPGTKQEETPPSPAPVTP